ncbi:hypothetical protein M5J07_17500 [Achromobacter mucicolens]|uniref:hypothetical protein n=1 Tax=Achromobacter mucicolens TaxID=1389922 RepID=UPI0020A23AFD|nr:hypothetical protein [Achromobacter mucicolens]MCP2516738.1 hypothetical protein [Achromobacter mucicolens]
MEKLFVEFTDSTASKINSVFGCRQDDEQFPNQGVVLVDDPRWQEYFLGLPDIVASSLPSPA